VLYFLNSQRGNYPPQKFDPQKNCNSPHPPHEINFVLRSTAATVLLHAQAESAEAEFRQHRRPTSRHQRAGADTKSQTEAFY
jgi:hypothetical protein